MVFALQMRHDPLNLRHHHRPMLPHRGAMRLDRLVDLRTGKRQEQAREWLESSSGLEGRCMTACVYLQQLALYFGVAALRLAVIAVITAGGL